MVVWLTANLPSTSMREGEGESETFATARIPQAPRWHHKQKELFCPASGASLEELQAVGPNRISGFSGVSPMRALPLQPTELKKSQLQVVVEHAFPRLVPAARAGNCSLLILHLDLNQWNNEQGGFCRACANPSQFKRGLCVSVDTPHSSFHITHKVLETLCSSGMRLQQHVGCFHLVVMPSISDWKLLNIIKSELVISNREFSPNFPISL